MKRMGALIKKRDILFLGFGFLIGIPLSLIFVLSIVRGNESNVLTTPMKFGNITIKPAKLDSINSVSECLVILDGDNEILLLDFTVDQKLVTIDFFNHDEIIFSTVKYKNDNWCTFSFGSEKAKSFYFDRNADYIFDTFILNDRTYIFNNIDEFGEWFLTDEFTPNKARVDTLEFIFDENKGWTITDDSH